MTHIRVDSFRRCFPRSPGHFSTLFYMPDVTGVINLRFHPCRFEDLPRMIPRSLSVLRLMFALMQNTHKKIIQIGQDYTFLSIISPYTKRKTQRRFRLKAIHTSAHSPCTASKPRSINRRKPMTSLMMPNTGSTVDLRWA